MAERKATATWQGSLQDGKGTMALGTGAWEGPFSFRSRFEEGEGSNPEELIAAAHAGCFSMAFSAELGKDGITPESVETTANVSLRNIDGAPTIARIGLTTTVTAPGGDDGQIREAADRAKAGCPVSRALASVNEIDLDLTVKT
jgi:osmotically inducible protein OsmC